ncbi:hypothetical protein CC85DRAFT_283357 [Cutaneotrichosporon oleaginosum]|uniref:Nucleotide-diphospho-sugar transferase n=1 Tax=Cutaneotrichosporon oleaginosum TaxID=879819 RepID=A0A0J0XUE1_9TREE|nr:uncharacterized protein CC85DRAFT_283357 [Cutaneotrichosporon oleaginosum]KLT44721.1 hypothetical protein CC85DRAFT_283357 [Cutaneotrichosporon oleaginosum]TXT07706.1 hypothetical protein COLE_04630 [Cutaneotrichosporon oleaginosum]
MRFRSRHALGVLIGAGVLLVIFLTHPFYESWHGFEAISKSRRLLAYRSPTAKHPILIVQHLPKGSLATASRASHALYAKAWGYRYSGDSGKYVEDGPRGFLNKEHVLRRVLLRELRSEQPAQWIVYTDADTFVSDPAVPLHVLLSPAPPDAHLLFGQDHNGVNTGVAAIRVSQLSLEFVDAVLACADNSPDPLLSDQHWIGITLRRNETFSNAFAEIRRTWFNAYFLDDVGAGTGSEAGDVKAAWSPQWQVHLVNHFKRKYSWRPMVERALVVYERGVEAAGGKVENEGGRVSRAGEGRRERESRPVGLDRLPQFAWAQEAAEVWWNGRRTGLEGIRFLDEELMKTVNWRGEVWIP